AGDWLDGVVLNYQVTTSGACFDTTLSIAEVTAQANDQPQTFPLSTRPGTFSGSLGVLPLRTTTWALRLTARDSSSEDIASTPITVNQPRGPLPDGRHDVTAGRAPATSSPTTSSCPAAGSTASSRTPTRSTCTASAAPAARTSVASPASTRTWSSTPSGTATGW